MTIDPTKLQRLIDGELDTASQRELLKRAEQEGHWREIAIGFVEDRQFSSCLRTTMGSEQEEIQERNEANAALDDVPASIGRMGPGTIWSLAALLVVSIGLGFTAGRWDIGRWSDGTELPSIASHDSNSGLANDESNDFDSLTDDQLASDEPDYHLELHDAYGNSVGGQIPLFSYNQAQQNSDLFKPSQVPQRIRQQFANSGYSLNDNIQYISGRLNDGRPFIIPVRTWSASPDQ